MSITDPSGAVTHFVPEADYLRLLDERNEYRKAAGLVNAWRQRRGPDIERDAVLELDLILREVGLTWEHASAWNSIIMSVAQQLGPATEEAH